MNWKDTRTSIDNFDLNSVDYLISIDETGTPTLKNINNNNPDYLNWFTISGCIFKLSDTHNVAKQVTEFKEKYWPNGNYRSHRVYLHSRDIRRRQGPFKLKEKYPAFRQDLDSLISSAPFNICSATINKLDHFNQYIHPFPVYQLALEFMIERIVMFLEKNNSTGVILLECRGWREDNELLQQMVSLLEIGNNYFSSTDMDCIKGVYFEKKLTNDHKKSYWSFEIADIVSYRINKYMISKVENESISILKRKILGYPNNLDGHGFKLFP